MLRGGGPTPPTWPTRHRPEDRHRTPSALLSSREFRFVVVGGANTVIGLGLFAAFHALLGDHVPYLVVLTISYAIAIVIAFTTQRLLVFRVTGTVLADFGRFLVVQAGSFALNVLFLATLVEVVDTPVLLGQGVSAILVAVLTYFGHLLFTFRRAEGHDG